VALFYLKKLRARPEMSVFWENSYDEFLAQPYIFSHRLEKVVRTISLNYGGWIFNWALNILG